MASFNKVVLLGRLTRDPAVKYTTGGTACCEIGIAVDRTWFDKTTNSKKEEVTFVDVTLWGRTAEVAGEYLQKGSQTLIEGRLQLDTWDDRETGQKRSKLRVVGENMTMLGGKEGSARQQSQQSRQPQPSQSRSEPQDYSPPDGGDEVPF